MEQLRDIGLWDWQYLFSLPAGEYDWIDFKDSRYLLNDNTFLSGISEYLSAFANYDGGYLIIGMSKCHDGSYAPDDGVPLEHAKYRDMKEWLEDKLPALVDPPLAKIGVQAISNPASLEKGVIVVHVAESTLAPHQGHKARFYSRRGSKLRALTTREIFDIKGRRKHPDLRAEISIFLRPEDAKNRSRINLYIYNDGDVLCRYAAARIKVPITYKNWFLSLGDHGHTHDQDGKTSWVISLMNPGPIFPKSSPFYPFDFDSKVGGAVIGQSSDIVEIRLYADEAPYKDFVFPAHEVMQISGKKFPPS